MRRTGMKRGVVSGFLAIVLGAGLAAGGPGDVEDSIDYARGSSGAPILDATGAVVGIVKVTSPVYYEEQDGVPAKLQMVWKYCVPSASLLALVTGDEDAAE